MPLPIVNFLAFGRDWWLPQNFSVHGTAIDRIFYWILGITGFILVAVEATLLAFLLRYRRRKDTIKAQFIHGNNRLELLWTIVPAVILLALALWSKKVWDNYRYSSALDDPNAAHVLVIAQQFNWNFIYAGPDRKLGKYLVWPRPTDRLWPLDEQGRPVTFAGAAGPASLSRERATSAIDQYLLPTHTLSPSDNPMGKVFDPVEDPDGADDSPDVSEGVLELPVNRPTVLEITSKDVIHDFYLPNFRINVYALPGSIVKVALTPTVTSKSMETLQTLDVNDLPVFMADSHHREFAFDIDEHAPGILGRNLSKDHFGWRYFDPATKATIIRDGKGFPEMQQNGALVTDPDAVSRIVGELQSAGITRVRGHLPFYWEIVCAHLCGNGHSNMEGKLYVLDQKEWSAKHEKPAPR